MDTGGDAPPTEKQNVYIGGPAALFAAYTEAKTKQFQSTNTESYEAINGPKIAYYHNGSRGLSNWKGSANYFHVRDCVPVYYWKDNSGSYASYITMKHAMEKKLSPDTYYDQVVNDPDFNMLRISFKDLVKDFSSWPLYLKNGWHMLHDVGFYPNPNIRLLPPLRGKKAHKAVAYVTLQHAALTRPIMDHYAKFDNNKPLLINSDDTTRAMHLELVPGEKGKEAFKMLTEYNNEYVPFRELPKTERMERGYSDSVKQALEFPVDGYFPPYLDKVLEEEIMKSDGTVKGTKQLKKLKVKAKRHGDDMTVTRAVFRDTETGRTEEVAVNELFMSLGPSARQVMVKQPNYSLWQHFLDVVKGISSNENTTEPGAAIYPPTIRSFLQHVVNKTEAFLSMGNLLPKMIWAAGGTSVLMVKVDLDKVGVDKLPKFRDHLDKHNRHFVRLGEKQVTSTDGKRYVCFALQVVGGGAFPSLYVHPETVLNAIKGNAVRIYGLEEEGIEYDILQVRSCARGITAQNAFRFTAPFSNMVQIYGIGGIGMTTLAPNALLMKALMRTRQLFSEGQIDAAEYHRRLGTGDFDKIPDFGPNVFDRNYAQFIDNANNPLKIAKQTRRRLGIVDTPAGKTYGLRESLAATSAVAFQLGSSLLSKRQPRQLRLFSNILFKRLKL